MSSSSYRLTAALLVLAACSDPSEPATSVDVLIDAGECTQAVADRVVVRVFDHEGALVETFDRSVADGLEFPTGVRLSPRGGDASRTWRVEAEVVSVDGVALSEMSARGGYSEGVRREYDLPFDDSCIGISCGPNETCRAALCVDDFEPTASLDAPLASCPAIAWVDGTAGADGESCLDHDAPCATVAHAFNSHVQAGQGIVVFVHGASTYEVRTGDQSVVYVRTLDGGEQRTPRVFRAWPGTGRPTFDASNGRMGFRIHGAHVIIDGFEVHGGQGSGVSFNGPEVVAGVVRNCEIWGNGIGPVEVFFNECGIVLNNQVSGITIVDNVIRDNVAGPSDPGRTAHFPTGIFANSRPDLFIARNTISGHAGDGIYLGDSDRAVIRNNVIFDNTVGISLSGSEAVIEDNALCDHRVSGISLFGGTSSAVRHNTVVGADAFAINMSEFARWQVSQNILAHNAGFGISGDGDPMDRENLYFMNAMGHTNGIPRDEPDSDLMDMDPLLVDVASCDLHLGDGSPARGAATDGSDLGARFRD